MLYERDPRTIRFVWTAFFVIGVTMLAFRAQELASQDPGTVRVGTDKLPPPDQAERTPSPFVYSFDTDGLLQESAGMTSGSSRYFWLGSGGELIIENDVGKTIQGDLPAQSKWRLAYYRTNPRDTDDGYHPQNLFRLVTRSAWENFRQEIGFRITNINTSASPYRNGSNGVFLFNRYTNEHNLYYVGLRVDGQAIIKKKIAGVYHTLASVEVFTGPSRYDRTTHTNLLPLDTWIGLRSEIMTGSDGSVLITLFLEREESGSWDKVLEARDEGRGSAGPAFLGPGYAGIRTDFMDVEFDDLKLVDLRGPSP